MAVGRRVRDRGLRSSEALANKPSEEKCNEGEQHLRAHLLGDFNVYLKPVYEPPDLESVHALIDQVVLGTLVAVGPHGLTAAHLPFLIDPHRGRYGTLISHLAAANPQAELITAGVGMMAIFLGPNAYVSASWFKQRDSAPTWAYAAAHCHGRPVAQDRRDSLHNITRLVNTLEEGRASRWHLRELGPDGVSDRMPRIVCFELPIERVEARFQLGQEERPADIAAAADRLSQEGNHKVAELIRAHNRGRIRAGRPSL
jgi:transcriptional regulator